MPLRWLRWQGETAGTYCFTLERIIDVSELSTFTVIYNGIAQVANEKKLELIDYYAYVATVNAGIDLGG